MSAARKRTAELLEALRPDDPAGRWVDRFLVTLIVLNVLAVIVATVPSIGLRWREEFQAFELFSVAVFTVEYLLRLWSSVELPSTGHIGKHQTRLGFALSPLGIIDLLAIAPFYIHLLLPETVTSLLLLRVFRGLRMLRLLKLTRYSPAMNVLFSVLRKEARIMGVAVFLLAVMLVLVSWGIYVLERDAQPDDFGTIPAAMWWSVITLTTVGFGDVVPITTMGKVFAGFAALLGIGMVALPSAILVAGLTREGHRRAQTYRRAVELALADGELTHHEATELKGLREELGIAPEDALSTELSIRRGISGLDRCPHCGKSLTERITENEDDH